MKRTSQRYEDSIALIQQECTHDPLTLEQQKQTLEQECHSGNSCIAIYQMNKDEYYFSHWIFDGVKQTKPLTRNSLANLIHQADMKYVIESKQEAINLMSGIPIPELGHYKLIYECRMKDHRGTYHRIVHQWMVLETSSQGKPCLLRLQLRRMPGDADETPPRGITIINTRTRKMLVSHAETRLTPCEIEVLKLLANGKDSSEIAELRHASIHTINNHRSNILRKTQTQDTGLAMMYAILIGAI